MQTLNLNAENSLPHDWQRATLVGRVWLPGTRGGPAVVVIRDAEVIDCTANWSANSPPAAASNRPPCTGA